MALSLSPCLVESSMLENSASTSATVRYSITGGVECLRGTPISCVILE